MTASCQATATSKTDRLACIAVDSVLCQFRVWPDGTAQNMEDGEAHPWHSKDYMIVAAHDEEDALARVEEIERRAWGPVRQQDTAKD